MKCESLEPIEIEVYQKKKMQTLSGNFFTKHVARCFLVHSGLKLVLKCFVRGLFFMKGKNCHPLVLCHCHHSLTTYHTRYSSLDVKVLEYAITSMVCIDVSTIKLAVLHFSDYAWLDAGWRISPKTRVRHATHGSFGMSADAQLIMIAKLILCNTTGWLILKQMQV